jgi:hypothetical protein
MVKSDFVPVNYLILECYAADTKLEPSEDTSARGTFAGMLDLEFLNISAAPYSEAARRLEW